MAADPMDEWVLFLRAPDDTDWQEILRRRASEAATMRKLLGPRRRKRPYKRRSSPSKTRRGYRYSSRSL
nr:MAG TPA: hypothetical protein [Caudoviricetes sp.]